MHTSARKPGHLLIIKYSLEEHVRLGEVNRDPKESRKQCCGSGSACFWASRNPDPLVRGTDQDPSICFYHQAKIVRKTLIPTIL
jgi:hypothetical protein